MNDFDEVLYFVNFDELFVFQYQWIDQFWKRHMMNIVNEIKLHKLIELADGIIWNFRHSCILFEIDLKKQELFIDDLKEGIQQIKKKTMKQVIAEIFRHVIDHNKNERNDHERRIE